MARTETKIPPELKDAATQLIGLDERVLYLEEKYGTNEKLADAILETSKTQKKFSEALKPTFLELIKTDKEVRQSLQEFISKTDRESLKRYSGWLIGALIFLSGTIITAIINAITNSWIR